MLRTHTRILLAGLLLLLILFLTACAKDIPLYVPPAERAVAPSDRPWVSGQFLALAYHDVEDEDPDQRVARRRVAKLHVCGFLRDRETDLGDEFAGF